MQAISIIQIDIMTNKIPLPDMSWSVKNINMFIHQPIIHSLMEYNTDYNIRETYLMALHRRTLIVVDVGHKGGLSNPCPWRGQCRAGFSTPVGLPSLI